MSDAFFWLEPGAVLNFLGPGFGVSALNGFADGAEIVEGVHGLHMPPIRRTHAPIAGVPGTRLLTVAHDMRTFDLPLMIRGGSEQDLRVQLRAWRRRFDPTRGDGQLLVATDDGKLLSIACRYAQGLEADEGASTRFPGVQLAVVTFEADDPYWYDLALQTQSWAMGGTVPLWFDVGTSKNILPVTLGASSLSGLTTLNVDGEARTWPVWTFAGPGSNLILTNLTTGRSFAWSNTLADSDVLVIDTRPGVKTVLLNGAPAGDALTAWDLWPLEVGANDVQVTVSSSTTTSQVTVEWHTAWLGP